MHMSMQPDWYARLQAEEAKPASKPSGESAHASLQLKWLSSRGAGLLVPSLLPFIITVYANPAAYTASCALFKP